jgi:hypothetical protein
MPYMHMAYMHMPYIRTYYILQLELFISFFLANLADHIQGDVGGDVLRNVELPEAGKISLRTRLYTQ